MDKEELINEMITISKQLEEVWLYHPDNPNSIDPVEYHKILTKTLLDLEKQNH